MICPAEERTIESINNLFKLTWTYSEILKYKFAKFPYSYYETSKYFIHIAKFVGGLNNLFNCFQQDLIELLNDKFIYNKCHRCMFTKDVFTLYSNHGIQYSYIKLNEMIKTLKLLISHYKQFKQMIV